MLSTLDSIEGALADLRRLAQRDLGDFVVFEYAGAEPIKPDDEYRSGLSVRFIPMLGAKRMQAIAIDLVIDEVPLEGAEAVSPADRIDVKSLDTCDYLVYPVGAALADKFCALAERHNGRASFRVKDLVDIVVYTLTCDIDGTDLQARLRREMAVRKIGPIESFRRNGPIPKPANSQSSARKLESPRACTTSARRRSSRHRCSTLRWSSDAEGYAGTTKA